MSMWLKKLGDDENVKISWMVSDVSESAPSTGEDEDFSSFYRWPLHATTGERLSWLRAQVQDNVWNETQAGKGGFFQEVLGRKPSPVRTLHLPTLRRRP